MMHHDLRQFFCSCLFFAGIFLSSVYSQDLASTQKYSNVCVGNTIAFKCDPTTNTNFTISIDESFYGRISPTTVTCAFNPGDCRENVKINIAPGLAVSNYAASTLITLSSCSSKKAEYLHVRWKCVPWTSRTTQTFNICDGGDITDVNGFITSPNYPTFGTVNNECMRKIVAPSNKVIRLRVQDAQFKNPDANNRCVTDYLKIIDTTDTYSSCGTDRPNYEDQLCSSVIYVAYKAPSTGLFQKGFKLYYEFADRSTQPDCSTATPVPPTPAEVISTTTPTPIIITDLVASPVQTSQVCRGGVTSLTPYPNYVLFIIDAFYGVPQSLTCEPYSSNHCTGPAVVNCPFTGECTIKLESDVKVGDCSNQNANYLRFTHRFLPIVSSKNFSICEGSDVDASANTYGIITSRKYPTWEPGVNCGKRIVAPAGKIIRVYLSDISIDPKDSQTQECKTSYVSVEENGRTVNFCGTRASGEVYWYASCSNILKISYKSSAQGSFYRGFNMYYEVVDGTGIACPDASTTPTTTTSTRTVSLTTQALVSTITSQIFTEGGNAFGKPCVFPFKYNGQSYETCINQGQTKYWCATTSDYDRDQERGDCKLGLTSTVSFDLCPSNTEKFYCPKGYLIYIVAAAFGVTSDGSCDYNKRTCTVNAMSSVKSTAGLPNSNIVHLQRTLTDCSSQKSNFLHIEFACVPDSAPGFDTFTIGSGQANSPFGIIQTPGYPSYQTNLNAQITINTASNKIINIYNVNTVIQLPAIGQICQNDKITITDNLQDPFVKCGTEKPDIFYQSCSSSININVVTGNIGSGSYKGSKLFYEVIDRSPDIVCPTTTIPTTPTTTGTGTTRTTTQFVPQYVIEGLSSPTETKAICRTSVLEFLNPPKITCPDSYIIAIRRSFFGISKTGDCFYKDGDCVSYKDSPAVNNCVGKQSCVLTHIATTLPECNAQSTYLQVEYDCIPTSLPARAMCSSSGTSISTFTDKKGIIKNPSYPGYDNLNACTAKITTTANQNLIKAYIIDMEIDDNCDRDNIVLFDSFNLTTAKYCGQQTSIFAIETCTSELTISLLAQSNADPALRGVLIYYEAIPKPNNFICSAFGTTTTGRSTTTTTRSTTASSTISTRPANYGLSLPVQELITCQSTVTISCPNDYAIVILSSEYATNDVATAGCSYSPADCFETTTSFNQGCSGKQSCPVTYFSRQITSCNKRTSKYLYMTYQCVPVANAGKPNPNPNLNLCTSGGPDNKITVDSSVIIQSPNFPSYPNADTKCTKKVVTTPGKALKVYVTTAAFKAAANCNGSKDYVSVSDCTQAPPVQCGSLLTAKLLMESVTNEITIDFSTTASTSSAHKGFQMYIEAVPSNATCASVTEAPSLTTTPPNVYLGFLSPTYHNEICVLSEKTLQCPDNYYVLVEEEEFISTDNGCKHSLSECKQPTDIAYQKCAGQSKCMIYHANTPLTRCQNKYADILDVEHVCLPASYPTIKTYTCENRQRVDARNGYIISPGYPSYSTAVDCEFNVSAIDGYGFKIYIVDLVLSEPDDSGNCADQLIVNGDPEICSSYQPRLVHKSNVRGVTVNYKSLLQGANVDSLRGFKLYFEAYSVSDTTLPTPISTVRVNRTTRLIQQTTIVKSHHSGSLTGWSLGLGIPAVLALTLYALWILKRSTNDGSTSNGYSNLSSPSTSSSSSNVNTSRVSFNKKKNNDLDDMKSFENPNFAIENTVNATIE